MIESVSVPAVFGNFNDSRPAVNKQVPVTVNIHDAARKPATDTDNSEGIFWLTSLSGRARHRYLAYPISMTYILKTLILTYAISVV